ncbi:MAG: 16S rRNA (cytosine(967)-C(5))-methyltransferase RsmB [Acidobacteria bacterium]|nr:MAG: 16S rRNA (cytosine(967)-C(5))-methyltransferase RsmB [Acidobacteriota bacterium]
MSISPSRAAAFEILLRIQTTDAYASELLHSSRFAKLSPADHGLLTELVMGVLRWRSVLDKHIAEHSSQSLAKFDLEVLTALRLGAYQLLFLDRIPTHAAVNESVELVKQARKRSAAGMVNAVLRKIKRGARDLNDNAHPEWLVERWTQIYGLDIAKQICAYDQAAPKTTIRIDNPALIEELEREGIHLQPGSFLAKAFVVEGNIARTRAFRERRLIIQDEASQMIALLVGKGNTVLDCCAAPGGKTRIMAEQNSDSIVVAMELHPPRAALLKKLVPNDNVRVIAADARHLPLNTTFDRVLMDAPCSGTGTLARNPEIKWRFKPEDISRLSVYQAEILSAAMSQVAVHGRVIYSTCSLEPEENEAVVEKVLAANPRFRVVECRDELQRLKENRELSDNFDSLLDGPYLRTIPGVHPTDGFFAAILERN